MSPIQVIALLFIIVVFAVCATLVVMRMVEVQRRNADERKLAEVRQLERDRHGARILNFRSQRGLPLTAPVQDVDDEISEDLAEWRGNLTDLSPRQQRRVKHKFVPPDQRVTVEDLFDG